MEKRRLVLVGSGGMLGGMVARRVPPEYELIPCSHAELDLQEPEQVATTLSRLAPDVIVNCAAFTNVDACETNEALASRINGDGPGCLAQAAGRQGAVLLHISTDYVFDGRKRVPYAEGDTPNPLSAYGRSKLAGERAIMASGLERWFVVRTSWLYGPGGKNFVETILRLAQEREELRIVDDQIGSPTNTEDLTDAIFRLLATDSFGIYHVSGQGECSWYEFACEIVAQYVERGGQARVKKIAPISTVEYPLPAPRPAYSVLAKWKYEALTGVPLPPWQESLRRYFDSRMG